MYMKLHANAATTPKTRPHIQQSQASVAALAAEFGVSQTTIRRWKARRTIADLSHTPKRLRVSLTAAEEEIVCELRQKLELPLDDIVQVMKRCVNAKLSRSAIHRCLVRHGISQTRRPAPKEPGRFDKHPFGFVHVDLKHLPSLKGGKSYVFAAVERATRFVHVEIVTKRDAQTIAGCLERFLKAFGYPVHTILTDNGSEFTDRFGGAFWTTVHTPSGRHPFDRVCQEHNIKHRLTKPYKPQTNGMVERFNRRISEALRTAPASSRNGGRNKFDTHDERNVFIQTFVHDYNRTRLRCLDYLAPLQALTLTNPPGHNTEARPN